MIEKLGVVNRKTLTRLLTIQNNSSTSRRPDDSDDDSCGGLVRPNFSQCWGLDNRAPLPSNARCPRTSKPSFSEATPLFQPLS